MHAESRDIPILDLTDPTTARSMPTGLRTARADVLAAARALSAIPEAALTRPWGWIGGSEEEVRYGAYRAAELLEAGELAARVELADAERAERRAARAIGPATAARWDLHGLLLPLPIEVVDADPGGGEWSIRLVVGHVISGQRGYGWGTAWWQAQAFAPTDPALPAGAPESLWADFPDEATTEAAGDLDALRERLDAILDLSTERFAGLPDERFDLGARWSGFPVTVGFRLGRWGSHIREHTIQVEKTLALLGHVPGEPARLARHLLAAYGRAEAVVYGRAGADDAARHIAAAAADALAAVRSATAAADVP